MNCSEIICRNELSPATVSHHLKTLAEAGLVETRREGQFIYNRALRDALQEYAEQVSHIAGSGKSRNKKR
jgi:ArsR family transcriptional regulator, arsenate/arsenite/antimonite-responsive transcriptional repressor